MSRKIIIPRKDHEVYFISMPEGLKIKSIRSFVTEQLDRLHPAFSAATVTDIQHFTFIETRWIMVSVMEAETLAEYRILNKGAQFFTNTSIAAHKKNFIHDGIRIIDDERIGFDVKNNEPVSLPLESGNINAFAGLAPELKNVPSRHGVFNKKISEWQIAAIIVCILLMILFPFAFNDAGQNKGRAVSVEVYTELAAETRFMPSFIEVLADISAEVIKTGGRMLRWQYNEDMQPFVVMQMQAIGALAAYRVCDKLEYAYLQDIQDVRYDDGEPHITILINAAESDFTRPAAGAFPAQNYVLPVLTELTNLLRRQDISIAAEALPAALNGNAFYTITYTAKDWNLIRSLEIITDACNDYLLRVRNIDISINGIRNLFTVICTLSQSDTHNHAVIQIREEIKSVPAAFGYIDDAPPVLPVPQERIETPAIERGRPVVGSIRDGENQIIFFRDGDGKIRISGEPNEN